MSPRKYVPLIIGALLLAALLLIQFSRSFDPASVGKPDGKSPDTPASGEVVNDQLSVIHVNVSVSPDQFKRLDELNRNFMMKYPYIQVTLTNEEIENKAYALWVAQSQQGTAADIMLLNNGWVRPFAVRGFLKPADSIMTGDALSDQMAGLLDPLKWNGYQWGVPKDVNPYVVVWNSTLLKQAGMNAPPSDWATFQGAAAKVKERNKAVNLVNLSAGDLLQPLVWLATFQSDPSNLVSLDQLNKEQQEQLKWLEAEDKHVSRLKTSQVIELNEALLSNKLLAAIMPWDAYEGLSAAARELLLIDRNETLFPWLNGRSYVIASGSKFENEAMLWIQEMTDVYHQQQAYDDLGLLPVRASLYTMSSLERSEQSKAPPAWWQKVLNKKQYDDYLALPDPLWPERWQTWERKWELVFQETLQIDMFIQESK